MGEPDSSLRFAILGPLQVFRGTERIEPATPRLRTLLVDLLVHRGEPRSAEWLIDDLWSGDPPRTAAGVLHNYMSQVRTLLGRETVLRVPTGYLLDVAVGALDSDLFLALAEEARRAFAAGSPDAALHAAAEGLALWRGEPLVDVATSDFAQAELARLREQRSATSELLIEAELASGRHSEVVAQLEAALASDPLRERLWWLLMTALHRSGRRADALQAYQRARRVLIHELGIEPGNDLRTLEREVLQQRRDAAPSREPVVLRPRARRPGLFGRQAELTEIRSFLREPAGLLLLTGEQGIGKSRLLADIQDTHSGLVLTGCAYEAERARPFGPWVDAFRSVALPPLPSHHVDALGPLLPDLARTRTGPDDLGMLYDGVVALLAHLADRSPMVVVLDDIHWLDDRSAALLHHVVRRLSDRTPFLASARPRELEVNGACSRTVHALRRDGLARQLKVGRLPGSDVSELVRDVAPDADPALIVAASNGNPLFALEMARAVARGGDPLSGEVDALIGERIGRLSDSAARLVPWLASFGRGVPPSVVAAAMDRAIAELLDPLTELEREGVVVADEAGRLDFTHELVRDAAYRRIPTMQRVLVHQRFGRVLATAPDPDDLWAETAARHAEAGKDDVTCATASVRAARRCVRLLAYDEAGEHVRRGREHARRLAPGRRVQVGIQLVDVLLHPGLRLRDPTLATELADLCALARRMDMSDELREGLVLLARVYHWAWGDIPRARALMQRAVDVSQGAGSTAEPLLECARCMAYLDIDMPRTRALFEELGRLGELAEVSHQYHWGRGLVLVWAGEHEAAEQALREAIRLAEARDDHWARFECAARLALLEVERGREPALDDLDAVAGRLGDGGSEPAYARAIRAVASADGSLDDAVAELERIDALHLVPDLLGLAAERALGTGDVGAARHLAQRGLAMAQTVHRPSEEARAHALLAITAVRLGEDASAHLAAASEGAERWPAHVRDLCAAAEAEVHETTST